VSDLQQLSHKDEADKEPVKFLAEITTEDIQVHITMQPVYCVSHSKQEVTSCCESCQRFVCNTRNGVKCKAHHCLDFADADDKFIAEINSTLKPLQQIESKFDRIITDISSAVKQVTTFRDQMQNDIDTLILNAEIQLRTLFEQILDKLKQCKDATRLIVGKSHSEQMDKLAASLADNEKHAHNIKQRVASADHYLAPTSSVFDR
jgi:hypothetical protein